VTLDDLRLYLPRYLSDDGLRALVEALNEFPDNIEKKMYSEAVRQRETIYQGDVLRKLPVGDLPRGDVRQVDSMVLSNTCDMNPENRRLFDSHVCYAPIVTIKNYDRVLRGTGLFDTDKIEQHIDAIRKQHVTQIFYLPVGGSIGEESIVFLDRISSCNRSDLGSPVDGGGKAASLSDIGLYLFVFKLSVHFTRIREGVPRE
jgi:hypothetical protein